MQGGEKNKAEDANNEEKNRDEVKNKVKNWDNKAVEGEGGNHRRRKAIAVTWGNCLHLLPEC